MKVSELMNPKGVLLYAKIDNSADALAFWSSCRRASALSPTAMPTTMRSATGKRSAGTTAIGGGIALPHACERGRVRTGHLGAAAAPRC